MRREWSSEDVMACWTPVGSDWHLVANKSGPTRLGFVLMLKVFELEGRFPQFPQTAVDYVVDVVKVSAEDLAKYDLWSRSAKGHRTQIREALGFRRVTRADEERLTARLADDGCPQAAASPKVRGPVAGVLLFWNWIGRSQEEVVQARRDWMEGTRFGEVKGYEGAPLPAPELPPVPLKPRGRVR